MDLGDAKAELVDGMIFVMEGSRNLHNIVQVNLSVALATRLRGSGCRPCGPDMALRTGIDSIRFPDVSVYCGDPAAPGKERDWLLGDPRVIVEILSESTQDNDQRFKLPECRALAGVNTVPFVDPETERVRIVARTGPERWTDEWLATGTDVVLDCPGIILPRAEIFARD